MLSQMLSRIYDFCQDPSQKLCSQLPVLPLTFKNKKRAVPMLPVLSLCDPKAEGWHSQWGLRVAHGNPGLKGMTGEVEVISGITMTKDVMRSLLQGSLERKREEVAREKKSFPSVLWRSRRERSEDVGKLRSRTLENGSSHLQGTPPIFMFVYERPKQESGWEAHLKTPAADGLYLAVSA